MVLIILQQEGINKAIFYGVTTLLFEGQGEVKLEYLWGDKNLFSEGA